MNTRPEDIDVDDPDTGEPDVDDAPPVDDQSGDPPEPSEIERLASEIGWAPKDQWRGNPDDWKSADEFLRGSVEAHKALRKTVEKQDQSLAEVRETIKRMAAASEKADERAYQKAVADLKAQQKQAVAEGDTEAYEAAEAQLSEIEKDKPVEPDKKADDNPDTDPAFVAFKEKHPWYGGANDEDIERTVYAEQIAPAVARNYQGAAFYDKVAEMVEKKFKESNVNPNRQGAKRVEGGGTARRGSNGKKSYADLPPEAKAACDSYVKQGLFKSNDDYVKEYFEQEGV